MKDKLFQLSKSMGRWQNGKLADEIFIFLECTNEPRVHKFFGLKSQEIWFLVVEEPFSEIVEL